MSEPTVIFRHPRLACVLARPGVRHGRDALQESLRAADVGVRRLVEVANGMVLVSAEAILSSSLTQPPLARASAGYDASLVP